MSLTYRRDEAVAEATGGDEHHGVGNQEHHDHPSHLMNLQPEVASDLGESGRDCVLVNRTNYERDSGPYDWAAPGGLQRLIHGPKLTND